MQRILTSCVVCVMASGATAQSLTLSQCTRTTHISHGGESDHVDMGAGRVMWIDWWSQEGTATDITLMDCAPGTALRFRSAETNMKPGRTTLDKTRAAIAVVNRHEGGARVFATFDRIGADLDGIAREVVQLTVTEESCACAALYPTDVGDKTPFALLE